jgi:subtilase family serine protease
MVFKKLISALTIAALGASMLPGLALAVVITDSTYDLEMHGVYVDDSGYLSVWVGNSGSEDVPEDTAGITKIYIDDMDNAAWSYSWSTLADTEFLLADSETGSVLRPQTLEGTHTVMACVDATDVVEESDEDNNCATEELTFGDPNLVMQEIDINTDGKLAVVYGNEGDTDVDSSAAGVTYIWIDDMDDPAWTYSWTTLTNKDFFNVGDSSAIRPQFLDGEHTVKACVDYFDVVEESDEDDNCLTVEFVSDMPDLAVQEIVLDDNSYLDITIGNEGDVDVESTTEGHTYIYIDDELQYTYSWTTLSDKSFLQVGNSSTMSPTMLTGAHSVEVCVDAKDVVLESDEDNNCLAVDFDAGEPDLVLQDLYLDGETLTIQMGNEGDAPAEITTGGVTYIWVDGVLDMTYSWKTLSDQSFVDVDGSSTIQPFTVTSDQTIEACVDYLDSVEESDETNNCMEVVFDVVDDSFDPEPQDDVLADLVLQDIYIDESDRLTVQVGNEGVVDVEDTVSVYIYINDLDNPQYTYSSSTLSDTSFLEVDGSSNIQPIIVDEDESYDIMACVDASDVVEEIYEDNNCMTVENLVVEIVYEYVADEEEAEETTEEVVDEEVFEDFASLWTDSDYPDVLYMSVHWGYTDPEASMDITTWDGSVNFEGATVGRPMQVIDFEEDEDWIDWDNSNPTMTSFVSNISSGKDGMLFKIKADLEPDDGGSDPFVDFKSEYQSTSIEVFLDELVADGSYTYEYSDDYIVEFVLETQAGWLDKLKKKALLQVRIGNIDGTGSESGEEHLYTVDMEVNEGSVIPAYMPLLLENHADYSGYDELTRDDDMMSLTLDAGIFGHQDGFLSLLSLTDVTLERGVTFVVTDDDGDTVFEQEFTKDVELGAFDLDDGSGNQIEIVNLLANRSDLVERAEEIFEDMFSWENQVSRFGAVISDLIDTDELDDDLIDEMNAVLDELLELIPGEDDEEVLPHLYKDITILTATLRSKINSYEDGDLTGDELNDAIAQVFDVAQVKLETQLADADAAAGYMQDVDYGSWYAKYMDMAIAHAFFAGYKDTHGGLTGLIGPANQLTRFQLIKIMSELSAGLDMGFGASSCDPDSVDLTSEVDWMEGHWASGYVQCLYDSSGDDLIIFDVIEEDLDKGTSPALRWEVIQFGFEILQAEVTDYSDTEFTFPDIGDGSGVYDDTSDMIQTAYDLGIITGYPSGDFGPFNTVNRAEMFKIITLFESVFSQVDETV